MTVNVSIGESSQEDSPRSIINSGIYGKTGESEQKKEAVITHTPRKSNKRRANLWVQI